jgi:hypothetical protein
MKKVARTTLSSLKLTEMRTLPDADLYRVTGGAKPTSTKVCTTNISGTFVRDGQ